MVHAHAAHPASLPVLANHRPVAENFVTDSTIPDEVAALDSDAADMVGFWGWVGGRYSMNSEIGLATVLAVGPGNCHATDEHVGTSSFEHALPMLTDWPWAAAGSVEATSRAAPACPTRS